MSQPENTEHSYSEEAAWKAGRLFPSGIEALVISRDDTEPPSTPFYRVDANLGSTDELVAADLDEDVALGIAHALDAVYGCGVYDEEGRRL